MTAVDHLIAALVELERESIEIEHRQSFIRSAIEAFGIDATATAQWMVKRCREMSLIDTGRAPVNHQAARDAAAAAL